MPSLPSLNTVLGSPASLISSGNFASSLATQVTGGVSSLTGAIPSVSSITALAGASLPGLPSIPSLPGLPSIPSLPSLPKIPSMDSLVDSAKGISASAFDAIKSSYKALEPGVPQNLTAIAAKATAAADAAAAEAPNPNDLKLAAGTLGAVPSIGSIPSVSSVVGSLPSLSSIPGPGAVTGALSAASNSIPGASAVTGALNNLQSKAAVGLAAGATAGISGLPGGAKAISNIVDNGKGIAAAAFNAIPGTASIAGLLKTGGSLASINPAKLSLPSLASIGLPAAGLAQLNSAISSLSSGGAVPIKMATVATNTTDRGEINNLAGVFGSSKIPLPNFSGVAPSSATVDKYNADKAKIEAKMDELFEQQKTVRNASGAYDTAKNSLPQGDPGISSLKAALDAAQAKADQIEKELAALRAS